MTKSRLEAFSDGVLAIIITIMVLELKAPHGTSWTDLAPLAHHFISYVLSFIYIGIYWNNHHHLFQVAGKVTGPVMWANLHLLFWLSLVPLATAWIGEHGYSTLPVVMYGLALICCAVAYSILVVCLISAHDKDAPLVKAIGTDFKGKISIVIYIVGVASSFIAPWLGYLMYASVALMWLVPDRRIEKVLN